MPLTSALSALERTYLSHLKLALVMLALSGALFSKGRFHPRDPQKDIPSPGQDITTRVSIPLGTLFAVGAIGSLLMGWFWYEHGSRGLRSRRGFVEGGSTYVSGVPVQDSLG